MKHKLEIPYHYGEIVKTRLRNLELDKKYEGFTLNEKLEIEKCECTIKNDGNWNYHNNYDNSENVLMVGDKNKWWTLNETEIKEIQKEHLYKAIKVLTDEIDRLKSIY
mgnify:CR=1 FL=1|jgi:hypothetical protein|tara:strand:+ start:3295 stop:3618 length:324 start_codon:yes stop_codon:yes gene_type:complete